MKRLITSALLLLSGIVSAQISINFTNITYPCASDGSVEAIATGGTAPYTYEWQSNTNSQVVSSTAVLSNMPGGYYWCKVTDANGLQGNQWFHLTPPFYVGVSSQTNATCPLNNNGSINFYVNGGSAPYDYVLNTGAGQNNMGNTATFSSLVLGTYFVTVTDANGCVHRSGTDSAGTIYSQATFTVSTVGTPANCNDGTATASVSGAIASPYTYYWNTNPPQTTAAISGLNGNEYLHVSVTDADGCVATVLHQASYGPNALQVYTIENNADCPAYNNGSLNALVSGGTAPYTYAWSTGATTPAINGLVPGDYDLTITDNAGCQLQVNKHIGQQSTVWAYTSSTPANCSNTGGTATVTTGGSGTPPYTYLWGDGQTTATATNLASGNHHVTVTDANGCQSTYGLAQVYIPSYCNATVSGRVINDMDGDCVEDGNESGIPNRIIDLGNGLYSSTNYTGNYSYSTLSPASYTIAHTAPSGWSTICPTSSYSVTSIAGQNISGHDFYDQPASLQNDVWINLYNGLARPGFNHYSTYCIQNKGTTTMAGTIEIVHDAAEIFTGGDDVIAYNSATRTITIGYNALPPGGSKCSWLGFSLPASVPIGTVLTMSGTANPVAGDNTPADNAATSQGTVVGSYDPNIKEVSPAGTGASGLIAANTNYMNYTIHFQNTGTYYAHDVVITDTLDADLDISSFEFMGSSHNVQWTISGPRVLTFTFYSILLPDSNQNEPASHGFASYRIKQRPNLNPGTEIKNTAYIFFDYNSPIVTNTTLNTIQSVGIKENNFTSEISIIPNPAQDHISISHLKNESCKKVEIMDMNGRVITSLIPAGQDVQLPEIANGVYIINAHFGSGIYRTRLVISK